MLKLIDALKEIMILAGIIMLGYGFYLIYPPAMFVLCGLALILFGAHGGAK